MKRRKRCCSQIIVVICFGLFFATMVHGFSLAKSDLDLTLEEDEWSWVPGEVATFMGTVSGEPTALNDITLFLSITPEPKGDETGNIVFTSVNEKKIKIRKQSESYTLADNEATSGIVTFTGSWFIPENSAYFKAGLKISALNHNGETLAGVVLNLGANNGESGSTLKRIPIDISLVNKILSLSILVIWFFVLLKLWYLKRKRS